MHPYKILVTHFVEETPPRCRKPRQVERQSVYRGAVATCHKKEAPLVVKLQLNDLYVYEYELRLFEGKTYQRRLRNWAGDKPDTYAPWSDPHDDTTHLGFDAWEREQREWDKNQLIIEGEWWEPAGLPVFTLSDTGGFAEKTGVQIELSLDGPTKLGPRQYNLAELDRARSDAETILRHYSPSSTIDPADYDTDSRVLFLSPDLPLQSPFTYQLGTAYPTELQSALNALTALPANADSHAIKQTVTNAAEARRTWFLAHTLLGHDDPAF